MSDVAETSPGPAAGQVGRGSSGTEAGGAPKPATRGSTAFDPAPSLDDVKETAKQAAGGVKDAALDAAGGLADAAKDQGRALYTTARDQATGFLDARKLDAAQSVSGIAESLRQSGQAFEGRGNLQAFVDSAADGLETLAAGIRDRSVAELYGEAERFARARPMTVALGAVVAGFVAARFIKSSADGLSAAAEADAPAVRVARKRPVRGTVQV